MIKDNIAQKYCLVIHSLQAGGMERVMSELANYFCSKRDLEIHLILYGIKRDVFYGLDQKIHLHQPSFLFNPSKRFISTIRTLFFLRKKITSLRPDVVLSFGEGWNNFVLLSLYGKKIPVFVSDRSQPDKSLGKVQDALRNWLYPKAAGVIAQTEKAKSIYLQKYQNPNISVIGNPIRTILESGKEYPRENIVLMVGRLIKTKHQDKLIELFVSINKPGWKLVIVGYDHLKQQHMNRLKQLVKELNAEDKVEFAGKQENVDEYYLRSKIFAFTSSSEGFPNVIGEAMAAGLPVVAFDCVAGPSDLIDDNKTGFLIPLFDYKKFQEKLSILMDDEILRGNFSVNALIKIKEFEANVICEKYFQFIK